MYIIDNMSDKVKIGESTSGDRELFVEFLGETDFILLTEKLHYKEESDETNQVRVDEGEFYKLKSEWDRRKGE